MGLIRKDVGLEEASIVILLNSADAAHGLIVHIDVTTK